MFYYWYWQWYLILYVLIPGSYQLYLQSFLLPLFYIPGIGWSWQQLRRHTELGNKFWRMSRRSGGTVYKQVKVRGVVISFIRLKVDHFSHDEVIKFLIHEFSCLGLFCKHYQILAKIKKFFFYFILVKTSGILRKGMRIYYTGKFKFQSGWKGK